MDGVNPGAVLDLPPARLAVTGREIAADLAQSAEERLPDGHRDLVLLLLQAVRPSDPTAVSVEVDHLQILNQREQVEGGLADSVPSLLAGRVVGNGQREGLQVRSQLSALVQQEQELAHVVRRFAHHADVFVADAENLTRFALQHQTAARRVRHDRQAVAGVPSQIGYELPHIDTCGLEVAVRLQREPAAVLRRDEDVEPVVLEDFDDHLPDGGLVVVGAAPVEVDDASLGHRAAVLPRPVLEGPAGEPGHGRVAMDAQQALGEQPQRACPKRPVGERRKRSPEAPEHAWPGDQLVAERNAPLLPEPSSGLRVDFRDLHALRDRPGYRFRSPSNSRPMRPPRPRCRGTSPPAAQRTSGPERAESPASTDRTSRRSCI